MSPARYNQTSNTCTHFPKRASLGRAGKGYKMHEFNDKVTAGDPLRGRSAACARRRCGLVLVQLNGAESTTAQQADPDEVLT